MNTAPRLSIVPKELPDPPYDKHTSANGYGFDLDVPRMQNSDSWAICPQEIRPWMMMSWVMSWTQHPCGSLPADDEIVAVRLGCSVEFLQVHRRFILRGWAIHSDGRLYHPVITEEVMKMLQSREKWKLKKRGQRAETEKQSLTLNVPRESPGSPRGVPGVSPPSLSLSLSPSQEEEEAKASLSEPAAPVADRVDACPHQKIIGVYHEVLPELPGVVISRWAASQGADHLRTRWREDRRHQTLDFWTAFFGTVRTSKHWMGENDRGWKADLRWLLERRNFDKVITQMVYLRQQEKAHG